MARKKSRSSERAASELQTTSHRFYVDANERGGGGKGRKRSSKRK